MEAPSSRAPSPPIVMAPSTPPMAKGSAQRSPPTLLNASPMDSLMLNPTTINWVKVEQTVKEIKHFLNSLNSAKIGWGRMLYNAAKFQLEPRSNLSSYRLVQQVSTLLDPRATFEKVKEGFTTLLQKIEYLEGRIDAIDPTKPEQLPKAKALLISLIGVQVIKKGVAEEGLKQLCKSYSNEADKASALSTKGEDAFRAIDTMVGDLRDLLLPRIRGLDVTIKLETYSIAARVLLDNRDSYRTNLRAVAWRAETGVQLPSALVQDCLFDKEYQCTSPNRDTLRLDANFIKLPTMAQEIPTQEGVTRWIPKRFIRTDDALSVEDGVVGTCERNQDEFDNLCNLYYRIDPDSKHVYVSCGAVNTLNKAEQLAYVMKETLQVLQGPTALAAGVPNPEVTGRWVVLQLNSFQKEQQLIRDVHEHVALNEDYLRTIIGQQEFSVTHVNTCFNFSSKLPSEDSQSLKNINIDALAQLAHFLETDLWPVLRDKYAGIHGDMLLEPIFGDGPESFKILSSTACRVSEEIKRLKKAIKNQQGCEQLTQLEAMRGEMNYLSESREVQRQAKTTVDGEGGLPPRDAAASQSSNDMAREKELRAQTQSLEAKLPKALLELREALSKKQDQLAADLQNLRKSIVKAIAMFQAQESFEKQSSGQPSIELEKALLLFSVFDRLLCLQLNIPEEKTLSRSRCSEIELFLLFFRLLKIKTVIICMSGLDRSGAVRAIADTQSHLEREWFLNVGTLPDETRTRLKVSKMMFDLIVNLDANRVELLKFVNAINAENKNKLGLIEDLTLLEKTPAPTMNIRDALFTMIDQKYSHNSQQVQQLKLSQYYLELVAKHLLSTEAEKTLYSTGVVGFKYLHDASWPKNIFANPHPLERWPQFVFVGNKPVILLNYSESWFGWWGSSTKITTAAMAIFLRLSQLRGK